MDVSGRSQFASMALYWPALVAASANEFAAAATRELVNFAIGPETRTGLCEPQWATRNRVTMELLSVRLRDFSTAPDGIPTLVCAPFALHGSTVADFAPEHSLVAALQGAGIGRLFVTEWRSASSDMRFLSIDSYLADLNVLVDELGGSVDLIGLCQGGWMALVYAARFPAKVRKLVLAGAPIDIAAGASRLSELACNTPMALFKQLVELGGGRMLGRHALQFWAPSPPDREAMRASLQPTDAVASEAFQQLESRFRDWYAWTVDLPGTYYLQVVEQVYKDNRLASGRFVALGRQIDLSALHCPVFLLAGRDDDVVAPEQMFASERLVDPRRCTVQKTVAPCGHLGLFMGKAMVAEVWPGIARWLLRQERGEPSGASGAALAAVEAGDGRAAAGDLKRAARTAR
jgi:poly(3-hydroxybutyrate) depolymerase